MVLWLQELCSLYILPVVLHLQSVCVCLSMCVWVCLCVWTQVSQSRIGLISIAVFMSMSVIPKFAHIRKHPRFIGKRNPTRIFIFWNQNKCDILHQAFFYGFSYPVPTGNHRNEYWKGACIMIYCLTLSKTANSVKRHTAWKIFLLKPIGAGFWKALPFYKCMFIIDTVMLMYVDTSLVCFNSRVCSQIFFFFFCNTTNKTMQLQRIPLLRINCTVHAENPYIYWTRAFRTYLQHKPPPRLNISVYCLAKISITSTFHCNGRTYMWSTVPFFATIL